MWCLSLGLVAIASAQDWGTSGAWQRVTPAAGSPSGYPLGLPPPRALHHAAYVPGYLLVPGNVTTNPGFSSAFDLWMFNIANNTWVNPYQPVYVTPTAYTGAFPPLPFIFSHGGLAVVLNEQDPSILYYVDTANQQSTFPAFTQLSISTPPALQGRVAQRFLNFGSTLYALGGWNPTTTTFSNDLYALDLAAALSFQGTGTAGTWIQVSPPANAAGVVPGYPFPRVAYSVTTLHVGAVMYGGVSRTLAGASPFDCLIWQPTAPGATPLSPPTDCIFHHHVFHFLPGMGNPLTSPYTPTMPAQAWFEGNSFTGVNGLVPAPRALHTAGAMGDQLYVYGGITAQGPSTELWTYNLVSETWALVSQSGSTPFGFGGVGCVIGRRLYYYENPPYGSDPSSASGSLYTWSPSASFTPTSGSSSNGGNYASTVQGHTAGIVIGILVGLSNLWLLFKLAENSGLEIFPAFIANGLGFIPGCGKSGGGVGPSTSGDFYTQVSSSSAPTFSGSGSSANYAPPPPL